MSIRLSCPSCNHGFALPVLPGHRRATCPRCGDVFPIRTYTEEGDHEPVAETTGTAVAPKSQKQPFWNNGFYLLLVTFALVVIASGVIVGMRTRDGSGPSNDGLSSVPPPSSELAALRYLRGNSNIVFAIRPEPLLAYAERTKQQPGDVLKRSGLPDGLGATVEQLGVPLAQIDHLAGGLELGEGDDAIRLTLVLVLKQPPADEDMFLSKLKARPVAGKRDRYDAAVGRFGLLLARVSPTVWVFGLNQKDFSAIEAGEHRPAGAQFRGDDRSGLRGMIRAVPADAAVWAAADDDRDWTQKPALKLFGNAPEVKKWLTAVKDGRGGTLAVRLGEQPQVQLRVRAVDEATAGRVRSYFAAQAGELPSARFGGEGALAEFDSPFSADTGRLLQRFLADAGR
ncbi:hypothetical protein GobsT_06920 [Gemmata obscuriglobus]|uniref:Uncharacterized protein n=1 Tax=Gemmata obscuriglobus TaxID=114 RepID=A0A2Z3H432_9BACT|nr:hypothetical protein [Gemmata obscuriglobus]AWM40763.1 hypothetical protein C1280_29785 [Gemmata obscuriglobus]QEG25957.1 hypothetical protein GobsT_06920 [Gemmata obscuriglobus]VTS00152.1 unnamed protein product [Gemmata obscuriglobus UQM 2246]